MACGGLYGEGFIHQPEPILKVVGGKRCLNVAVPVMADPGHVTQIVVAVGSTSRKDEKELETPRLRDHGDEDVTAVNGVVHGLGLKGPLDTVALGHDRFVKPLVEVHDSLGPATEVLLVSVGYPGVLRGCLGLGRGRRSGLGGWGIKERSTEMSYSWSYPVGLQGVVESVSD